MIFYILPKTKQQVQKHFLGYWPTLRAFGEYFAAQCFSTLPEELQNFVDYDLWVKSLVSSKEIEVRRTLGGFEVYCSREI